MRESLNAIMLHRHINQTPTQPQFFPLQELDAMAVSNLRSHYPAFAGSILPPLLRKTDSPVVRDVAGSMNRCFHAVPDSKPDAGGLLV